MVKKINPEHISYYALIIEEKTKFKSLQNAGKLKFLDEDVERKMYHLIVENLEKTGLKQYEVSIFLNMESNPFTTKSIGTVKSIWVLEFRRILT